MRSLAGSRRRTAPAQRSVLLRRRNRGRLERTRAAEPVATRRLPGARRPVADASPPGGRPDNPRPGFASITYRLIAETWGLSAEDALQRAVEYGGERFSGESVEQCVRVLRAHKSEPLH